MLCCGHMFLGILRIIDDGAFNKKKKSRKTNETVFTVEKVIKRKGNKLHVKWKSYDNSTVGLIKKILL